MRNFYVLLLVSLLVSEGHAAEGPYRMRAFVGDKVVQNTGTIPDDPSGEDPSEDDVTPPVVVSLLPPDDASDVWKTTGLVVEFDEDVVSGSGNIVISNDDASLFESIPVSDARVSISGRDANILPSTLFVEGNTYHVTFAPGVFTDTAGNPHAGLTDGADWNFTIAATPVPLQNVVGTNGAVDWEVFTAGGQTWMLVSNNGAYPGSYISSPLFRFAPENPDASKVVFVEDVMTSGSYGWASAQLGSETYIFGSFHNDGDYNTQSPLYRFVPGNPDGSKMQLVETLTTSGPVYPTLFNVDGELYVLVPNYAGSLYGIPSWLLRVVPGNPEGSRFQHMQNISTQDARGFEVFVADGETYVVVGDSSASSRLYRFVPENPDSSKLVLIQTIPSSWALRWHHFEVEGEHYLAVANFKSTANIFRFSSTASPMVSPTPMQSIPLTETADWDSFTYGGTTYLVLAQATSGISYLYRFVPGNPDASKLLQIQTFETNFANDWAPFVAGGNTYLAVANRGAFYGDASLSQVFRFYP